MNRTREEAAWGSRDLADLALETQELLATVRAEPARGRRGRDADPSSTSRSRSEGRRQQPGKQKRKRRGKTATSTSADAAPAKTLAVGRETVEILDTMSNPNSPRDDDAPTTQGDSATDTQLRQQRESETAARNLEFGIEEQRVRESADRFVPRSGTRLEELDNERRRLERIQEAQRRATIEQHYTEMEKQDRQEWLGDDRAASSLQRVFRGHIGRRKARVVQEIKEQEEQIKADWIEVRDQETGDVWYFNQSTHESQWEMPAALASILPSSQRLAKLPDLSGETTVEPSKVLESTASFKDLGPGLPSTASLGRLPSVPDDGMTSRDGSRPKTGEMVRASSLPDISRSGMSQIEGAMDFSDDEDEEPEGGISSHSDARRLFLADGSSNTNLRDTVRNTLQMSRFDSVATLLMAPETRQPRPRETDGEEEGRKPVFGGKGGKSSMVSVLKLNKSGGGKKRGRQTVAGSAASNVKEIRTLAIRDVPHPGFDLTDHMQNESAGNEAGASGMGEVADSTQDMLRRVNEICFNCWSAGRGKFCVLHVSEERMGESRASESALMCKNWDLSILQKRYRSEEIQEIFMKSASSLRYDKDRKKFVTVEEQKHPIYRAVSSILAAYNFTARRRIHQVVWVKSLVEQLRIGKIESAGASRSAAMLRLRNTIFNSRWVRQYATSVMHLHPKGPTTGTTLAERRKIVEHLVSIGQYSYIFAPPVPIPVELFLPRKYELPAPKAIPMPRPSYKNAPVVGAPNRYIRENHPAAWFERLVARSAREAQQAAGVQVVALSPMPGVELLRRTKYPPPHTLKFASFARKPTPGNLAVGGLSAELTVHQLIQTLVPPQFGNYTVMHKMSVAPNVSPEITAIFHPLPPSPLNQIFVFRYLQHPLNSRRPPTIMIPTSAAVTEKHFYGSNRPEQTGEELSHGFRTSAFASGCDSIIVYETSVQAFEPNAEVATPNLAAANQTVTTHVDHTYPFCEPSNRNNTTLDFYHLLLLGVCSPNKEQVFTNFSLQECGEFMKDTDMNKPLGSCLSMVYRSWAFVQRQLIEEFLTDDGLPYWYNRQTGETFWERPLAEEEKVAVKEGGTILEMGDNAPIRQEDAGKRYRQEDVRKLILKKHESPDQMIERRKLAAQSAKWAREDGKLPPRPQPQRAIGSGNASADTDPTGSSQSADDSSRSSSMPKSTLGPGAPPPYSPGKGAVGTPMSRQDSFQSSAREPASSRGQDTSRSDTSYNSSLNSARWGPESSRMETGRETGRSSAVDTVRQGDTGQSAISGGNNSNPMVHAMSQALGPVLSQLQRGGAQPADLLQLGMGLGMSLQAQGLLPTSTTDGSTLEQNTLPSKEEGTVDGTATETDSKSGTQNKHPIGLPDPTVSNREVASLDHTAETSQQNTFAETDPTLSTAEKFKGIKVIPTTMPDEETDSFVMHQSREMEAAKKVPVFAYPPELLGKDYVTHPTAGEGTSFMLEGQGTDQKYVKDSKRVLRRSGDVLPEGFFNKIYSTAIAKAECDYLPSVPNLPQTKPVGRVKPRSAAEDWFAIGFDPWSAGKDPLSREFIPSLTTKEESLLEQSRKRADESFIEVMDKEGARQMEEAAGQANKLAQDFQELASWARHGKYREIEDAMNQPDWNLPIDYQDDTGSTLLHVAAQNGNKRIAKLCLRRGASINKQNLNGQGVLHYACSYGFNDLADYFISKGADDSLRNADGLTCYEGLSFDDVANI